MLEHCPDFVDKICHAKNKGVFPIELFQPVIPRRTVRVSTPQKIAALPSRSTRFTHPVWPPAYLSLQLPRPLCRGVHSGACAC